MEHYLVIAPGSNTLVACFQNDKVCNDISGYQCTSVKEIKDAIQLSLGLFNPSLVILEDTTYTSILLDAIRECSYVPVQLTRLKAKDLESEKKRDAETVTRVLLNKFVSTLVVP